jgi:hypothetical protein
MFKPTYLYIKRHNKTGLRYFGKTTYNPLKYKGSGKHWHAHLKKHGNDVSTIWYRLFYTQIELTEFALSFSAKHDIVKSKRWANILIENGLDGGPPGLTHSETARKNMSKARMGFKMTDAHKRNSGLAKSKPCTIDGVEIFPTVVALIKAKGQGKLGLKHPDFRYVV